MGIEGQLSDVNGQQYLEGQLKDADMAGQNGAHAWKERWWKLVRRALLQAIARSKAL
jgi:hypothetical protein